MTDAISSNNRIKAPSPPADNRAKGAPKAGNDSPAAAPSSAVVELTSDQVMEQMQRLPEVDNSRIEAIKNALANGEYKPDPEIIAQKFSEIEKLLP